jgi:hypothetical protein
MTKIAGSGSISQRHGSLDPDPDPPQNVMDPQHCFKVSKKFPISPVEQHMLKEFDPYLYRIQRISKSLHKIDIFVVHQFS